jgi:hypothetical protein
VKADEWSCVEWKELWCERENEDVSMAFGVCNWKEFWCSAQDTYLRY